MPLDGISMLGNAEMKIAVMPLGIQGANIPHIEIALEGETPMITISKVLPNGDIPRITVGVPHNPFSTTWFTLEVQIKNAMDILDQLAHPEAPTVFRMSEAEYAVLIKHGMTLPSDSG